MEQKKRFNYYQLPEEIKFCKKCITSNQQAMLAPEFKHTKYVKKPTIRFDEEGVCDPCRFTRLKYEEIDWNKREEELLRLLDKYRRKDGYYDVLVPGSGGKDSVKVSWELKYKYGMHPLTFTWPPHMYTEIGWRNFRKWIDVGGFDNITFSPNGRVHRLLTKLAYENILHPFQPFVLGQKHVGPKLASKLGIKLIFMGEHGAEYCNPISENLIPQWDNKYFAVDEKNFSDMYLSGVSIERLVKEYGLTINDLEIYFPPKQEDLIREKINICAYSYFKKWLPMEHYYDAVKHIGFEANPERTEGTFTKYSSLDDKIDGFQYWTTFIKYGIGRTTQDAAPGIRQGCITRDEGVALVRRYDGEFPKKYFKEVLEYMDMTEERFFEIADEFRSPHIWEKVSGEWKLKKQVS